MDLFLRIVNNVGFGLNVVGAVIIIWGVILSLFEFLRKGLLPKGEVVELNEGIRLKLGSYLVLALEFFIAGDIIKTIITPTWQSLGILGAVVIIRTVLSYFLTKDLKRV